MRTYPARVLLTTDTVGGVWTYSLTLAQALESLGIEVALATLGGFPSPSQQADAAAIRTLRLYPSDYRLPWMDDPWDDVEAARGWLLRLAHEVRPDLIHLSEPVFGNLPWPAPVVAVAHSCVLSWWEAVLGEAAPPRWDRYRRAMTRGLAAANAVAVPSRAMGAALRKHYNVGSARVVQNGRNPEGLRPGVKEPLVLTAGRIWDQAKNVLALDRAAEGLAWPVYAAGDSTLPGGGAGEAPVHLRLLGRLSSDELAAWLSRAAIYALPARYEPFGLSAVEAALSGCALVLGDLPSLRELWDGVAVFVPPDDPGLLRTALDALIEDPDLRWTLAMRARRRALGFSGRRMAMAYRDLYGTLMQEAPACAS